MNKKQITVLLLVYKINTEAETLRLLRVMDAINNQTYDNVKKIIYYDKVLDKESMIRMEEMNQDCSWIIIERREKDMELMKAISEIYTDKVLSDYIVLARTQDIPDLTLCQSHIDNFEKHPNCAISLSGYYVICEDNSKLDEFTKSMWKDGRIWVNFSISSYHGFNMGNCSCWCLNRKVLEEIDYEGMESISEWVKTDAFFLNYVLSKHPIITNRKYLVDVGIHSKNERHAEFWVEYVKYWGENVRKMKKLIINGD